MCHTGAQCDHTVTATHCNTLQHTATHCNTLQHICVRIRYVKHIVTDCDECVAVCCSVLQCVAVCCSVLQCVAVCCSVLQWLDVMMNVCHTVTQCDHTATYKQRERQNGCTHQKKPSHGLWVWLMCVTQSHNVITQPHTGWRRPIKCLKLQVIFRKRATNYMALLRIMIYNDEAFVNQCGSQTSSTVGICVQSFPCVTSHPNNSCL